MTSCHEFFNRLRKLAFSVDKETNGLREALENSEISAYDENRACLLMRETLAEVKALKKEINAKVEDSPQKCTFEDFISACSRIVSRTKEQMNELEDHLVKYGYTKPIENLPDVTKVATSLPEDNGSVPMDAAVSSEQSDSGDDASFEKTSDTEKSIPMEMNQLDQISGADVEDILKTPEPPVTFTKMIEVTPQRSLDSKEKVLTDTEMRSCSTPEAPQTNTPMIKPRLMAESTDSPNSINSTPQGFLVPPQPVTVTPMLKHADLAAVTPPGLSKGQEYSDLPAPPIMGTPGFKTIVLREEESPVSGLESSFSLDSLPPPPDITSVQLLKPDDVTAPPIQSNPLAVFVRPLNEQEYSSLPVYVANQFTLESINQHLQTINGYLAGSSQVQHEPVMVEQDLRDLLNLGAATKAFMLVLVKTGRLKLTGKKIMFFNSA
ncbi:uncharacterized protein LOC111322558 [Stylophora pistillata]|uniref:Spindle and kinetochore-associated protein 3 n=1 Tax=Stylophora pistillata TaxID=50429 RepID=A0A2B4SRH0_STYPI|nr:uncharacterized protein LOC111322558 [Stylophora pistillata]PFX31188.1 Spindle and kinetochore-associated protein 3 [Stylophora pistillata]